jgi:hypothetical protein
MRSQDEKTTIFVRKFQLLENFLKKTTNSSDKTDFHTALKKASERNICINKNYHLIEDLYALRNVFSHRDRGKYIAKVNDFAIKKLDSLTKLLKNPPTVISKFKVDVFQAKTTDEISFIMQSMSKNTYTHVPVWNGDEFIGVFSYTSLFEWLAEMQKKEIEEVTFTKKFMRDINRKYLNSPCVNFEFIKENLSIYEIPPKFEEATRKRKRLDCLLITKDGIKGEQITGIITSWDLGAIT